VYLFSADGVSYGTRRATITITDDD